MQAYSNPLRQEDPYSLPDLEIFQLTADEVAEMDEELIRDYSKKFPLAGFNSRDRQALISAIVEGENLTGGWFYHFCFPGCLPDSSPFGPFDSAKAALADAREQFGDDE